jgi:hypothetical protein
MKIKTRKRFDSVKEKLEKAKREAGILGLHNLQEAEKTAGKLIFDMAINEEGSQAELRQLVSHGSILQAFFAGLDHRDAIMSRVNQDRSRAGMRDRIQLLYEWLDQNINSYRGRLEDCAEDAAERIDGLRMTAGTVKKHITQYRKQNKTITIKSPNLPKKKTKVAS